MRPFANYFTKTKQQNHVIVWTVDMINPDFQTVSMKPSFSTIKKKIFSQQLRHLNQLRLYHFIIYFIHLLFMQMMMEVSCFLLKKFLMKKVLYQLLIHLKEILKKKINIEVECDKKRRCFQYNLIQIK